MSVKIFSAKSRHLSERHTDCLDQENKRSATALELNNKCVSQGLTALVELIDVACVNCRTKAIVRSQDILYKIMMLVVVE